MLNHKKLFRLYREERLVVRRRGGRKRSAPVCIPGRGVHGVLQLHRALVQPGEAAFCPRLPIAHGLRSCSGERYDRTVTTTSLTTPRKRGSFTSLGIV